MVRGTNTVQPYRARLSHQFSFERPATTRPIVSTRAPVIGPCGSLASTGTPSISEASVVSTVRCAHVVPCAVTATRVWSARPCSMSALAASGTCVGVACRISGPGAAARAAQSTSPRTSATVWAEPGGRPA
ncbi:Uncharacterised protein [Mycobacteroides abscessus subsp. abscessus]|nr:Uncharacterised protein [Mycobacteroides abscessus subsp. abscessus]SKU75274.1 Uncharacterised protein [Mycobacteroides abscessus subsp. abscessus]